MSKLKTAIPEEFVFQICEKYLGGGRDKEPMGASRISDWLREEGFDCSRERVHKLVAEGIRRGYLRLYPPRDLTLTQRLADRFNLDEKKTAVVKTGEGASGEHLATRAAEMLLDLIREVGAKKERVHVGFGAGRTTRRIARALSICLRAEEEIPPITVHALSSGFSVENPTTAPVVFFSYFADLGPKIQYVGLFAPAVVKCEEYNEIIKLPGVRESFEARDKIDIVVSSVGRRLDPHGLLSRFMQLAPPQGREALEKANWVGDVHWRPFSPEGPIEIDTGIRATTMFELGEVVDLVANRGKHALLVVGPCSECERGKGSKASALHPLLTQPSLRVFDYLVTDRKTAEEALAFHPAKGQK